MERASPAPWTAADFNDKAAIYYRERNSTTTPPTLTDDDLARIRQRRAELFAEWEAVPPGAAIELPFPPDGPAADANARDANRATAHPRTASRR